MANEKRLIDAKFAQHIANVELSHDEAGVVQWVLSHTPTVDAVEVVRCKDCKSYDPGYIRQDHGWCKEWWTAVRASGFCHHGERRTDGN